MIRLRQLTIGGLLLGLGACFVACGGDDTAAPGTGGSGGSDSGTGGTAGKGGTTGTGGSVGGGGSGTGGSKADGAAGTAGIAGAAEAGPDVTTDVVTTDKVTTDVVTIDVVTTDVVTTDVVTTDVVTTDVTSDVSDAGNGNSTCPATEPVNGTDCTSNGRTCFYASADSGAVEAGDAAIQDSCVCHTISAGVTQWTCTGADGGGGSPACPVGAKPEAGTTCTDGGVGMACRFGNTWCFCEKADGASTFTWGSCL
jgi:hypothetical protein